MCGYYFISPLESSALFVFTLSICIYFISHSLLCVYVTCRFDDVASNAFETWLSRVSEYSALTVLRLSDTALNFTAVMAYVHYLTKLRELDVSKNKYVHSLLRERMSAVYGAENKHLLLFMSMEVLLHALLAHVALYEFSLCLCSLFFYTHTTYVGVHTRVLTNAFNLQHNADSKHAPYSNSSTPLKNRPFYKR